MTMPETRRGLALGSCGSLVAILVAVAAAPLPAPPDRDATRDAMRKLDFLVGDWSGSGWMQLGPDTRIDIQSRETLASKLEGMIVAVECAHEGVAPGNQDSLIVFRSFGVISYDTRAKKYNFRSWQESGRSADYDATVSESTFEWGTAEASGRVRHVVRIDDQGLWQETGETSPDGTHWRRISAMTLSRTTTAGSLRDAGHE
jgi:hypothetical protein